MFFSILLGFAANSFSSCNKFLEINPKDDVSDDQTIVDAASARTAIRGVYRALSADSYYGNSFPSLGYLNGDNVQWTGSQSIVQQFISHNVHSDNGTIESVWTAIYATINRANNVIAKLPNVIDVNLSDSERNQIKGEAFFVRALSYFDLARTWGGVQLKLNPTVSLSGNSGIKRSTLEETYVQVLNDLDSAEVLLPLVTNRVRATKKTAWALKSRYYLYQQDWPDAETYATKLITDNNYSLLAPYNAWWANDVTATAESIFELAYSANYTNSQRNQWQPPANGGTRQIAPSDAFLLLVNDPSVGGNRSSLVAQTTQGLWYGNLYYRSPATDPAYVIRIAELYLIRAEARAQQGNLAGALSDLNIVRNRAGLTDYTTSTKADALLAIENENRIEFALEAHRWFDLVRTNRAQTVLGITDNNRLLMPIPINELTVDPNLTPNAGY
ncbi:RagB/SusD family nutrient uptake outer membrane protein [Rhizosphaericola mali]|nr:RagB/SusD family nutrient uptake outer membrane protein [Rhizosphaericola mali]